MSIVQPQLHSTTVNSQLPHNLNPNLAATAMAQQSRQYASMPVNYPSQSQAPQFTQHPSQNPSRRPQAQAPPNQPSVLQSPADISSANPANYMHPSTQVHYHPPQPVMHMQPSVLMPVGSNHPTFPTSRQRSMNPSHNAMNIPVGNPAVGIPSSMAFPPTLGPMNHQQNIAPSTARRQPIAPGPSHPHQIGPQQTPNASSVGMGLNQNPPIGSTATATGASTIARGHQSQVSRQPQNAAHPVTAPELQPQGLGQPVSQARSHSPPQIQHVAPPSNGVMRLPRQQLHQNLSQSTPTDSSRMQHISSSVHPPALSSSHNGAMQQHGFQALTHNQSLLNSPLTIHSSHSQPLRDASILQRSPSVSQDPNISSIQQSQQVPSPETSFQTQPQRAPSRTSSRTSLRNIGDGSLQGFSAGQQDIMSQTPQFISTPVQLRAHPTQSNPNPIIRGGTPQGIPQSQMQEPQTSLQPRLPVSQDMAPLQDSRSQPSQNVNSAFGSGRPQVMRTNGAQQSPQQHHRTNSQPISITQRTFPGRGSSGPESPSLSSAMRQPSQTHSPSRALSPAASQSPNLPIGHGQASLYLLQFVGALTFDHPDACHREFWDKVVEEFFHPEGVMRVTLWKDNLKLEAKPFNIGLKFLPRFFVVAGLSGVKGMSFSLDGASERIAPSTEGAPPYAIVECKNAAWIYQYHSGYTVILRGHLVVNVYFDFPPTSDTPRYSIKCFNFDSSTHEQQISVEAISGGRHLASSLDTPGQPFVDDSRIILENASIPSGPINAFGIPQVTMRCLELAESCELMTELMEFSQAHDVGPSDALKSYAAQIRENQPLLGSHARHLQIQTATQPPSAGPSSMYPNAANPMTGHAQTYSRNSPPPPTSSLNTTPSVTSAAPIQHVDTTPNPTSTSAPVPSTPTTPSASNKRKTNSVSASESGPPSKRPTRPRKGTKGS